ncbi:MAG: hypothetical protein WCB57_14800 [Pseudonocardiaceae bacterium]
MSSTSGLDPWWVYCRIPEIAVSSTGMCRAEGAYVEHGERAHPGEYRGNHRAAQGVVMALNPTQVQRAGGQPSP